MIDIEWAKKHIGNNGGYNKDYVYYRLRGDKTIDWIDLSVLPKKVYKGKKCIAWEKASGFKVKFKVDDLIDYIVIGNYNKRNRKIEVHYKDKQEYIDVHSIQKVYIKKIS